MVKEIMSVPSCAQVHRYSKECRVFPIHSIAHLERAPCRRDIEGRYAMRENISLLARVRDDLKVGTTSPNCTAHGCMYNSGVNPCALRFHHGMSLRRRDGG
uniref:Uncharacterized protein n=1 Tax=Anopheles albimanus TaxID=7167 RepID=A0A182FZ08_ANOAL